MRQSMQYIPLVDLQEVKKLDQNAARRDVMAVIFKFWIMLRANH